jgi:hypothetical protein
LQRPHGARKIRFLPLILCIGKIEVFSFCRGSAGNRYANTTLLICTIDNYLRHQSLFESGMQRCSITSYSEQASLDLLLARVVLWTPKVKSAPI